MADGTSTYNHRTRSWHWPHLAFVVLSSAVAFTSNSTSVGQQASSSQSGTGNTLRVSGDIDQDGLPDDQDSCPAVSYTPQFKECNCASMDLNPGNDPQAECKARERVAQMLVGPNGGILVTHMAFAVVKNGVLHFADAFTYLGAGQYEHDPDGIYRLYRIGSTTKSMTAVAAKALEEAGQLSLSDFVNDDDATQEFVGGQRTLSQLLSHKGAFKVDNGAIHLFCYPNGLASFWLEPDDLISPHYNSAVYGNLGGGYNYSAFNFSLAGAYLANRTGLPFQHILQTRIFDLAGMCTATLDGLRAKNSTIGAGPGVSQAAVMHVGPYINLVSPTDPLCEDNFYSSNDVYGQSSYSWQYYQLDEAAAEPRDPAGGVIASAIDLAHFAETLLASYHGTGGLLTPAGIRQLWGATSDLGCGSGCPYERYYGTGFFTNSLPGQPVTQVGHGGSRAGYATAFVLRPEDNSAVCILGNADLSTVALSNLAKSILDDFEAAASWGDLDLASFVNVLLGNDTNPAHFANADKNCDGAANGLDVELYVRHVLGN
jgi:CubicO group peptidase (beta-lactamase class C family)